MAIRMTQVVFEDEDGIIHYRLFEPHTVCGESVIRTEERGPIKARTIRVGDAFPRSRVLVLPQVTCMLCLVLAEDRFWA